MDGRPPAASGGPSPITGNHGADVTGSVFITCETMLDLTYRAAQARLANLVNGGGLTGPSQAAYERGLEGTIRVGPFGDMPGASKLVRVRFLDPVYRDDIMTVALRWEAAGATGGLFPVLDADITLTPAGENTARLAMTGSYRPPLGRLGADLDRMLMHRVATATLRQLLGSAAETLTSPAPASAGEETTTAIPWPQRAIEPDEW